MIKSRSALMMNSREEEDDATHCVCVGQTCCRPANSVQLFRVPETRGKLEIQLVRIACTELGFSFPCTFVRAQFVSL